MTIEEILTIIAPEIPDNERREYFIDSTKAELSVSAWGSSYNNAVALLTAHKMTFLTNNKGGVIKRKKAGDEEIEYFGSTSALMTTGYGMEFIQLRKKTINSFTWSNNNDNL